MFESLFNLLCVTFKCSYFEKHLRATTSRYLAKEFERNFMKQRFLVDRKERLNTICETKPNTVHLKQQLLYCLCSNKAKIWPCYCCKAWIAWLCWSLHLLILYKELVMLSFPSFPFIVFFLQVLWCKFTILIKFSSKKTNQFWAIHSKFFLSPVSL